MKKITVAILMLFLAGIISLAEETTGESTPKLEINILSYLYYVYDLSDGADYNGFEMARGYLDFKLKLDDTYSFRITPDFVRKGTSRLEGIIKYAYLEINQPFGLKDTQFRLGVQPTAWEGYMTKWWGYRWINRVPAGTHKFTTSSDLGASLLGSFADKMIRYQLMIRNGEGYSGPPEGDSAKSFEAIVQIQPVKSMPLNFFLHGSVGETTSVIESKNNLYAGAVYYKDSSLQLGAEYVYNNIMDTERSIISFMGAITFTDLFLLGRYDIVDPDSSVDMDKINFILAGIGYKLSKNVQTMLDVQYATSEDEETRDDIKLYLHWEIRY